MLSHQSAFVLAVEFHIQKASPFRFILSSFVRSRFLLCFVTLFFSFASVSRPFRSAVAFDARIKMKQEEVKKQKKKIRWRRQKFRVPLWLMCDKMRPSTANWTKNNRNFDAKELNERYLFGRFFFFASIFYFSFLSRSVFVVFCAPFLHFFH